MTLRSFLPTKPQISSISKRLQDIVGSVWTFCAIDAETKLVPAFKVGQRNSATADAFVADVASRMRNRVQISTDGLHAYESAIEKAFGHDVDYAQIVKIYGKEPAMDRALQHGRRDWD